MLNRARPDTLNKRLDFVLAGRSPWKWADKVALNSGAMGRLRKGSFPDPEKLIPACRIENMSLTWLIEGRGAPFLVATLPDDTAAATCVTECAKEDVDQVIVARCHKGFAVVIHTQCTSTTARGDTYDWRQVTVLGGAAPSVKTQHALDDLEHMRPGMVFSRAVDAAVWADIASGRAGTYRMFGDDETPGVLCGQHVPYTTPRDGMRGVADEAVSYAAASDGADELLQIFSGLADTDRSACLRMARGLRSK